MTEFGLIRKYFTRPSTQAVLGIGDDAALLRPRQGLELAVSTDMLVSGTHFFPDADPGLLGCKSLAVNLSDMAAMGAQPRWALLSLALPEADEMWLEHFSTGFFALADEFGVELIGGDTTRGPLNVCITIMGEVPQGEALRRSGAQAGDDIWVSGGLGGAALALAHLTGKVRLEGSAFADCAARLHRPQPRVALGLALRGVAHSAIDISDGLLADLGHILECSAVGASVSLAAVPVFPAVQPYFEQALGRQCALAGGDDYELCFTAPVARRAGVEKISAHLDLPLTRIGSITRDKGCIIRAADGSIVTMEAQGHDHFR